MPKKSKEMQYYQAVGRRKDAVAKVRLYITGKEKSATVSGKKIGQGEIMINDKLLNKAFTNPVDQKRCILPLEITNSIDRFAISIKVNGGGMNGQLEAIMHGLSRALILVNTEEYRPILKDAELLTRDARTRERRKVGTGGKARRAKQSPKR
jgi:small subunit ribosomal protein S9